MKDTHISPEAFLMNAPDIKGGLEIAWDSVKLGFLAAKSEFIDRQQEKKTK